MQWLHDRGGTVDKSDFVKQLAGVGASGKFLNNAERDTHRLISRIGCSLNASIELKDVRMVNPSTMEENIQKLPMVLPHSMCLALWNKGEDIFRECLFGGLSDEQIKKYWDHHDAKCSWFRGHPARGWPTRGRITSIGTYGDEVQAYRNSECGVISVLGWTAELACRQDPLLRYFATTVWSEHHESPNTYNDALGYIIESFRSLMDDVWPWTKAGYLLFFSFAQGDLKWICDRMGIHNFRRNEFCSRCHCVKTADNVYDTLPNFSDDPECFPQREYSHADLLEYSPLFSLPLTIERVQHDVAHSQLLGTGKAVNGALVASNNIVFGYACCVLLDTFKVYREHRVYNSILISGAVLIHLCEAHFFGSMAPPGEYKERLAPALRRAHRDFLLWKRLEKKQCSQPRFTPSRLNRTLGTSSLPLVKSIFLVDVPPIEGYCSSSFYIWVVDDDD